MSGKKFLVILLSFLFCFAFLLYMYMYLTGWFDIFLDSGFKYYKDDTYILKKKK